jgi:uncharacterized RDD family membrane protein YckC
MKPCPKCNLPLRDDADECFACGHDFDAPVAAATAGNPRMRPCPNPGCTLQIDVNAVDCVCGYRERDVSTVGRMRFRTGGVVRSFVGADFWERAFARVLDRLVGLVMGPLVATVVVAVGALILKGPAAAAAAARAATAGGVAGFLMFALSDMFGNFGYQVTSEYMAGGSLGKRMMGLRVVGDGMTRASLEGVVKRNLAYFVDSFFFGLVGYLVMKRTPLRKRLGDHWGETIVTHKECVPGGNMVPASEASVGIAVALLIHVFVRGTVLVFRL